MSGAEPGYEQRMLLIFGLRTKASLLGVVTLACGVCGQSGPMRLVRESTRFSLFFVPLIPVRTKHVAECANPYCGARFPVDADEARRLTAGR